jgi:hypothetical protein
LLGLWLCADYPTKVNAIESGIFFFDEGWLGEDKGGENHVQKIGRRPKRKTEANWLASVVSTLLKNQTYFFSISLA